MGSENTAKGETWTAEVWCSDGEKNSTKVNDTVTIQNTAPTIGAPTINDTTPYTNDVLLCQNGSFSDIDQDSATWYYRWYDDGSLQR